MRRLAELSLGVLLQGCDLKRYERSVVRIYGKAETMILSDKPTDIQKGCVLPSEWLKIHFSAINFHRTILPC